jgi:hypothetical protein
LRGLLVNVGELGMNDRIELLREVLHEAIDKGNIEDILKASIDLDTEIVNAMNMFYVPNKVMYS